MSKNLVTMNELLGDYGQIIDQQRREIENLIQKAVSENEELKAENLKLRVALTQIADIVGGAVMPTASLQFITEGIEREVRLVVTNLQADNERLRKRIEKLSKRKPTEEEAVAQYHWLKENSSRYKQ